MRPHPRYASPGLVLQRVIIEPGDQVQTIGLYAFDNIRSALNLNRKADIVRLMTRQYVDPEDKQEKTALLIQDADNRADAVVIAPMTLPEEQEEYQTETGLMG